MKATEEELHQADMQNGEVEAANRSKLEVMSRRERGTKFVRRIGKRTGTTPHFAKWKQEAAIKSALQRMNLARIADQAADEDAIQAAHGFAILYVSKKYKTVWDLVQLQSRGYLMVIDGIGDKRIDAMAAYLKSKRVDVPWADR